MIAQALRLHQTTVDHHIHEFMNKGKLKPENVGSDSKLSAEQTSILIKHLSNNFFTILMKLSTLSSTHGEFCSVE